MLQKMNDGDLLVNDVFARIVHFFEDPSGAAQWDWQLLDEDVKAHDALYDAYLYVHEYRPLLVAKIRQIKEYNTLYILENDVNKFVTESLFHDSLKEEDELAHRDTIHMCSIIRHRKYLINMI